MRLGSGQEFEGARLAHLVGKMVTVQKLVERIEKRGVPRPLVDLLLRGRVKDKETFSDKARLMELIQPLRDAGSEAFLERDEEHGVFDVKLQTSGNGHPREVRGGRRLRRLGRVPRALLRLRGDPRARPTPAHGGGRR